MSISAVFPQRQPDNPQSASEAVHIVEHMNNMSHSGALIHHDTRRRSPQINDLPAREAKESMVFHGSDAMWETLWTLWKRVDPRPVPAELSTGCGEGWGKLQGCDFAGCGR